MDVSLCSEVEKRTIWCDWWGQGPKVVFPREHQPRPTTCVPPLIYRIPPSRALNFTKTKVILLS